MNKKISNNKCNICGSTTNFIFDKKILNKYKVDYFRCLNCGFIQTEKPYWLDRAYSSAIINSDTGILDRNVLLSKISTIVISLFSGTKSKVLDYAGGYGLMTRLLRDIGIESYWQDKYASNLFANGFNYKSNQKCDVITAFEFFEHVENMNIEMKEILKNHNPKMIIFSTTLHNGKPLRDWWYLVPEGGQHISLYTKKSLSILAKRHGMRFSTNGINLHILSKMYIPSIFLMFISGFYQIMFPFVKIIYKSKTISDMKFISKIK